jgi:predicted CoA-binding protein
LILGEQRKEKVMNTAVEKALELKRIAVVGLSKDPAKAAHTVPRYLQNHGYKIYPVNPFGGEELLGEKVYQKASEVEGPVDMVLVFRPSAEVRPVVEDALRCDDLKAIWLQEGIISTEAERLAAERDLIFVQDKCMFKEHRRLKR